MRLTDTLLHWSPARADAHQVLTALALDCWFDGEPDDVAFIRTADDVAPSIPTELLPARTQAALDRLLAAESLRGASADLRHLQPHHDSFFQTPWPVFWLGIDHAPGRRRLPPGLVQQLRDTLAARRHENPALTHQRAHTILVLTVSGSDRPRPDVYLAGPALRGQTPDSEQRSVVKVFDFSRIEHASENALRGMIGQLHQLATPEGCQHLFDASQAGDVRSVVRRALKDRLAELMTLLEEALPHVASPNTPLRALREAASVLVFRLMFLGELERRGLLYGTSAGAGDEDAGDVESNGHAGHGPAPGAAPSERERSAGASGPGTSAVDAAALQTSAVDAAALQTSARETSALRTGPRPAPAPPDVPTLLDAQAAALDDDDPAPPPPDRDLLAAFRHLTAVLAGRTRDPRVAVRGGSLFASRPNERFEDTVVAWLDAFDADTLHPAPELRRRWNRTLAETLHTVQGVVDQREAAGHVREAEREIGYLGLGAVAHTHRVLGDVYEQVLALTPKRTERGITLTVGGREATTESNERKALGAHYTAESLVEEVVRPALGGRLERLWEEAGQDADAYLRRLEQLRLVDPAMGSAHFLTTGARELASEIIWVQRFGQPRHTMHPRVHTHPVEGPPLPGLEGEEESSFHAALTRILPAVVQRSCFGVDVSPIAVELGKLSLWLFTMAAQDVARDGEVTERPDLAFLDGNIRCGDSLLGVTWTGAREALAERLGVSVSRIGGPAGKTLDLFGGWAEQGGETAQERHDDVMALQAHLREDAARLVAWARTGDGRSVLGADAETLDVYGLRQRLHERTRAMLEPIRYVFDLALLVRLLDVRPRRAAGEKALRKLLAEHLEEPAALDRVSWQQVVDGSLGAPSADVAAVRAAIVRAASVAPLVQGRALRSFHWGYEFPSVFDGAGERAGFDVILANPPFLGGQKLTGAYGKPYREFIVEGLGGGQRGSADLSAYFVLLFAELLAPGGVAGTLTTNTIAQGDTREVGLDQAVQRGLTVFRAVPSRKWPGSAVLEVAHVWLVRGEWPGPFLREDTQATAAQEGGGPPVWEELPGLTPYLTAPGEVTGPPRRLPENAGKSFQGSNVLGLGFTMTPDEAEALIAKDARNAEVLFPYLNGRDITSTPDQAP
ncbi:MAG: hypothetical protein EA398_14370, partial [Deltaproteobacteria bacterium]